MHTLFKLPTLLFIGEKWSLEENAISFLEENGYGPCWSLINPDFQ